MSAAPLRAAAVRVPCSTSNLGPGFDCLGLAFQRYLDARFTPGGDTALRTDYTGTMAGLGDDVSYFPDLLASAFTERLHTHGFTAVSGLLTAHSEIPVARGLGSSAAATVAGLLLADAALGLHSDPAAALTWCTAREGHPDNSAPSLLGGLVAVARAADNSPSAFRLPLSERIAFAFAAPALELPTPAMRAALPAHVSHALAARELGRLAALLQGLATGEPALLALGLLDELHVPHRLPLIPRAGEAFAAAAAAGAWGATISGSGSGLIALCAPESAAAVLSAMEHALAQDDVAVSGFVAAADLTGARLLPVEEPC